MGKGNRTRNNGYQEAYNMSGASSAKAVKAGGKKKMDKTTFWMTVVIAILVVGAIALSVFATSGIVGRNTVLISSDNYEVDANMITYYENQVYSNLFNQYFSYYYQYFYQGNYEQAYTAAQQALAGKTLKSYYSSAIESLKEILVLCESAKAEGVALDTEDIKTVDETMAQFEGQISQVFGTGVTAGDIRKAVELQALATKYYNEYTEKETAAVTEEEKTAFIENNKGDFYVVDYISADLSVLSEDFEGDEEGFAAAKALVDEYVAKLEGATTLDAYKTALIEYTVKSQFDELAATEIDSAKMPDQATLNTYEKEIIDGIVALIVNGTALDLKGGEEGSVEAAINTITTTLVTKCNSAVEPVEQAYVEAHDHAEGEEADHEEPTEEQLWLCASDRKIGDTYKLDASDDTEYGYTVYMVASDLHVIEDETKDVGHILVEAREGTATEEEINAAKKEADELLAKFLAGDKTEDSFEALGLENTDDSNVFYDNVTKGKMVEEFENWLFDSARKVGDAEVVQTELGFHVMLYRGGSTLADVNAKIGVVNEKYTKYLEANKDKVTVNEKAADKYSA